MRFQTDAQKERILLNLECFGIVEFNKNQKFFSSVAESDDIEVIVAFIEAILTHKKFVEVKNLFIGIMNTVDKFPVFKFSHFLLSIKAKGKIFVQNYCDRKYGDLLHTTAFPRYFEELIFFYNDILPESRDRFLNCFQIYAGEYSRTVSNIFNYVEFLKFVFSSPSFSFGSERYYVDIFIQRIDGLGGFNYGSIYFNNRQVTDCLIDILDFVKRECKSSRMYDYIMKETTFKGFRKSALITKEALIGMNVSSEWVDLVDLSVFNAKTKVNP